MCKAETGVNDFQNTSWIGECEDMNNPKLNDMHDYRDFLVISREGQPLCKVKTSAVGARELQVYTGCKVVPYYPPRKDM